MTAMLGGDKAMDDEAQKLTSIYLRTSQRDLFHGRYRRSKP